jgi:hypothetical protein
MCVDVYVNSFLSYFIYIYTDLTEKVRGGMGTRREGLGGMKNWRKEKIIFVYFI